MELSLISLVAAGVTFLIVVTTTVVYAKKAINIQNDYNTKIQTVTSDVNQGQKSDYEYNMKQDSRLKTQEQELSNVKSSYVKASDMASRVDTGSVQAKSMTTASLNAGASTFTGASTFGGSATFNGDFNAKHGKFAGQVTAEDLLLSRGMTVGRTANFGSDVTAKGNLVVGKTVVADEAHFKKGLVAEDVVTPLLVSQNVVSLDPIVSLDTIGSFGDGIFMGDVTARSVNTNTLNMTQKDAGAWMQYRDPQTIAGIGQFPNNQMRLYGNASTPNSKISLGFSTLNGQFNEAVGVGANLDTAFAGGLTANRTSTFNQDLNVRGNLVTTGNVTTNGVETVKDSGPAPGHDWYRLNRQNANNATNQGVAVYNGLAINDGGGLSVGAWGKVPTGELRVQNPNGSASHLNWNRTGTNYFRGRTHVSEGIRVEPADPGVLIEKTYGTDDNRYGLGQWTNGATRVYTSQLHGPASVNLSVAKPNNTFDDVLRVEKSNDAGVYRTNITGNVNVTQAARIGENVPYNPTSGNWREKTRLLVHRPNDGNIVGAALGGPDHYSLIPDNAGNTFIRPGKVNGTVNIYDNVAGIGPVNIGNGTGQITMSGPTVVNDRLVVNGGAWNTSFRGKNASEFTGELVVQNGPGGATHFNHLNQGKNFLRGETTIDGITRVNSELQIKNANNTLSHFNWNNRNENYIRGNTWIDGNTQVAGQLQINGPIRRCDSAGNNCVNL